MRVERERVRSFPPPAEFLIYRYLSGIYHFLINFSSGMVWWYMKVVFDSFDYFQLAQFDFFRVTRPKRADRGNRATGSTRTTVMGHRTALRRQSPMARCPVSMPPLTDY